MSGLSIKDILSHLQEHTLCSLRTTAETQLEPKPHSGMWRSDIPIIRKMDPDLSCSS